MITLFLIIIIVIIIIIIIIIITCILIFKFYIPKSIVSVIISFVFLPDFMFFFFRHAFYS